MLRVAERSRSIDLQSRERLCDFMQGNQLMPR